MKKANYANRISAAVCALLLFIAAAVAALVAKPVGAVAEAAVDLAAQADNIVKIEDIVDELSDAAFRAQTNIKFYGNQWDNGPSNASAFPKEGTILDATTDDSADEGVFRLGDNDQDSGTATETKRRLYSQKQTASNITTNANAYDGNLGIWSRHNKWGNTGFAVKQQEENKDKYIAFRMKYLPSSNFWQYFIWSANRPQKACILDFGTTGAAYEWKLKPDGKVTLWYNAENEAQNPQQTSYVLSSTEPKMALPGQETDVVVVFGVRDIDGGTRYLYFKMFDDGGNVYYDWELNDSELNYSGDADGSKARPEITTSGWYSVGWKGRVGTPNEFATYIGGVDGPLVNEVTEDVTYEDSGDDELTLADYDLPAGYTWENPDEKITSLAPRTYRAYKNERYFGSEKTYYNVTVDAGEKLIAHSTVNAEDLVDDIGTEALAAKDKIAVLGTTTSDFTGISYEDDKGNLSISFKEQNWKEVGVAFKQTEEAKNKLISFRFKYDLKGARTTQYYVFSWTAALPERGYLKNMRNNYSWWFVNDSTLRLVCITENSSTTAMENETNRVAEYTVTGMPTEATDMIVTYGILADENDNRTVYINLRGTDGKEYINYAYDDSAYGYPAGSKPLKPSLENGGWYSFGKCQNITSLTWDTYIGGIKEPLVNKGEYFDFTLDGGDYKEEQTLSEVDLSGHEGYSWKEGDSQLSAGTHA